MKGGAYIKPVGIMIVVEDGHGGHVVMGSSRLKSAVVDFGGELSMGAFYRPSIHVEAECEDWTMINMPPGWRFDPGVAGELTNGPALLEDTSERLLPS